jgi:DNA-binding transcriptional ArsR family regulator
MSRKRTSEGDSVKGEGTLVLSDPAQLRALGSPVRVALFELLVHGPASAGALAQGLGVPRTRLYHHLKILEEGGLIEVVGVRRVRGTTERTYRAVATEVSLDPGLVGQGAGDEAARAAMRAAFRLAEDELIEAVGSGRVDEVVFEQEGVRLHAKDYERLRKRLVRWLEDLGAAHDPGADLTVRATVLVHPSNPESRLPPGP